jgi:hypothetical protein
MGAAAVGRVALERTHPCFGLPEGLGAAGFDARLHTRLLGLEALARHGGAGADHHQGHEGAMQGAAEEHRSGPVPTDHA